MLSSGMLSAQKKGGDKINIALVGMGAEGEVLLNSIVKLPYINVVAVCDIWQPRCEFAAMRIMRELKQAPARYTIKITPKDRLTPLVKRGRIGEIKGENYEREISRGSYFFLPYAAENRFRICGRKYAELIECLPSRQ